MGLAVLNIPEPGMPDPAGSCLIGLASPMFRPAEALIGQLAAAGRMEAWCSKTDNPRHPAGVRNHHSVSLR